MRCMELLGVATLLARMFPAVILPLTFIIALKGPGPFLDIQRIASIVDISSAWLLVSTVITDNRLLDLSTITSTVDSNFAGSAQSLMARPRVSVFTARHQISTDLATAPPNVVIGIDTSPGCGFLATKAALNRTHMGTWRTRTSVT